MVGGVNWTNRLTRSVLAVLTHHRHKANLELLTPILGFNLIVLALDSDPRHLSTLRDDLLSNYRDIVLGRACDNAC